MTDQLQISNQKNSKDMSNITFSQALAAGLSHSDWLNGQKIDPSLRDRALANHSACHPQKAKELKTSDICGRHSGGSLHSVDFQQSVESKLQAKLDCLGSPEYAMTWKSLAMPSQPPICALRAVGKKNWLQWLKSLPEKRSGKATCKLVLRTCDNGYFGWVTPQVMDSTGKGRPGRFKKDGNRDPMNPGSYRMDLKDMATIACLPVQRTTRGVKQYRSFAGMGKLGVLNPELPRWLMGFPEQWDESAPTATPSSRKSQKNL